MCRRSSGSRWGPSGDFDVCNQHSNIAPDNPASVHTRSSPASGGRSGSTTSIGQRGVTRTLRNAIASGRIAQAFVFAGPRGVGKTTTARILARGAELRERARPPIRAASATPASRSRGPRHRRARDRRRHAHRQVDNVREVIIAGLGDRAGPQPLQDLHHRRSPPALDRSRSTRCSSRSKSRRRTSSS